MENPLLAEAVTPAHSSQEYRALYGRSLMVLRKLRGVTPTADELCRITSVGTLAPGLWITVKFLDGSTNSFRPELIEPTDFVPAVES